RAVLTIALPFLAVIAWASLQAVLPVPPQWASPLWPMTGVALGRLVHPAISLDPHGTLTGVARCLTYAGVFWVALQLACERAFADRAIRWIAVAGFVYAAYGIAMHVLGIERILWIPKWAYQGFLTSTFVNRNSYATYAALGFFCALALLLQAF